MNDSSLPIIPTHVIGSYAWPGWYHCCHACAKRGEFGPFDLEEQQNDAVDPAIRDQEGAGLDVISDGKMRRANFFTAALYGFIPGLEPVLPARLQGAISHDQQHRFRATKALTVPDGFGTSHGYCFAQTPLMVPLPGPYTLTGRSLTDEGEIHRTREEVAWAFVPVLQQEIHQLFADGARYVQIDEPTPVIHKIRDVDIAKRTARLDDGDRRFSGRSGPEAAPDRNSGRRSGANSQRAPIHLCQQASFSQTPQAGARGKAASLVAGTGIVRAEIAGRS